MDCKIILYWPIARTDKKNHKASTFFIDALQKNHQNKTLHRLRHQIFPSNQTENGDFVVFVKDAERPQNLVQS